MKANASLYHLLFEFRTGVRDKGQLLLNYLFPLGLYLLLGLLMAELNPFFRETAIPAMIVIAIISSTILGLPNPLVSSREAGIFRSYKINGVPAFSVLSLPALTSILHITIVVIIITLTAPLLIKAPLPKNWAAFILLFLLGSFTHAGFGMLISVISSNTRSLVLWSQILFIPTMLLGGLMIPIDQLPQALSKVALLLPATHIMNAMQQLAWGHDLGFNAMWPVMVLLSSGILSIILANLLFYWDNQNIVRRTHPITAIVVLVPFVLAIILQ